MHVGLLGGAGHIGLQLKDLLAGYDVIDEISIADRDYEAAQIAARATKKCKALSIDVTGGDLIKFVADCDLIVNLVGPYYKHGVRVLQAAIDAGRHYVDINDDWEPTFEMLALDKAARDAGVTAIIGMGSSPGLTNMLAAKVASSLDSVDRLFTGWTMAGTVDGTELVNIVGQSGEPSAAMIHWLQQVSGTIEVVREGVLASRQPLERVSYSYPGIGDCVGWTIGHPEPITFLTSFPGIQESYNLMGINAAMASALREVGRAIDGGHYTVDEAAAHMLANLGEPHELLQEDKESAPPPIIFAIGEGLKDGARIRVGAHPRRLPKGSLDAWTAAPLAVGVALLAQGAVRGTGVMAPEMALDPDSFFESFEELCVGPRDGHALVDLRIQPIGRG